MTTRVLLVGAIVVAAAILAWVLERRRVAASKPVRTAAPVPSQIDRTDFARPGAEWLVLLFSSDACESCAAMAARISPLENDVVAVDQAEYAQRPEIHDKYGIESVPVLGFYDRDGVARETFVGSVDSTTLWASLGRLRGPS